MSSTRTEISCGTKGIHQVLDCSPTNRERELGLDRRETESGLEATHAPVARLPTRSRGLWPPRARVVGAAAAADKSRAPPWSVIPTERRVESFADDLNTRRGIVSGRVALLPRSTEIQPFVASIRPSPIVDPIPPVLPSLLHPVPFGRIRVRFRRGSLRNGYHIQGRQQARKLPNPDTRRRTTAKAFAKDVFINQERKLGAQRRSDTVLVSTINDTDQGSADVAFRTPPAPYEKSKSLGSGGSMVARLKLKGIDGRAPPGVEPVA
ncbi:hypothetical protein GOBAR_DD17937 [Gossypium barbadense]|nr:hypothetical protein GOBAR_DD17937 [Gossypium barbadense]